MSEEQLKDFWEAVEADPGLQQKLKTAGRNADAFSAIAKEDGFIVSAEEISGEEGLMLLEIFKKIKSLGGLDIWTL